MYQNFNQCIRQEFVISLEDLIQNNSLDINACIQQYFLKRALPCSTIILDYVLKQQSILFMQILIEWVCDGLDHSVFTRDVLQNWQDSLIFRIILYITQESCSDDFSNHLLTQLDLVEQHLIPRVANKLQQFLKQYNLPQSQPDSVQNNIIIRLDTQKWCPEIQADLMNFLRTRIIDQQQEAHICAKLQYYSDQVKDELYRILIEQNSIQRKQQIVRILIKLRLQNDAVLQLGVLNSKQLQIKEEQAYFEQWSQENNKLWLNFDTLISNQTLVLSQGEFKCNQISRVDKLSSLLVFAKVDASEHLIKNALQQSIRQRRTPIYPRILEIFLIDRSLMLQENNQDILTAIQILIKNFDKSADQHQVFAVKVTLVQFLIQCLQNSKQTSIPEQNICQFIHQTFLQNIQVMNQVVLDGFTNIEKVIQNVESLHVLILDIDHLLGVHHNKEFLVQLGLNLKKKYRNEASEICYKKIVDKFNVIQPKIVDHSCLAQKAIFPVM